MSVPAYVLAGGRSSRMGQDKARMLWRGVPMAVRVACTLRDAGHRVAIIRRGQRDERWSWPEGGSLRVVHEPAQGATHPLRGVVSALEDAGGDCVIAPCDVPLLEPDDVRLLLHAGAPCVAWDGERIHPLIAVLSCSMLDRARRLADEGGSARALMRGVPRVRLPASRLRNVNRPEDLE